MSTTQSKVYIYAFMYSFKWTCDKIGII